MICPKCSSKLIKQDKRFVCEKNHSYDIARQGYVNLILNGSVHGDSKEMVVARTEFLNHGYYACLQEKLCELIEKYQPNRLVDLGCGEGYYTSKMALHAQECIGVDLSKDALKTAARIDKKSQYIVASIFHLPIEENSVDCITNIFAPTPLDEVKRILKEEGVYIRVTPHIKHLYEFKQELYKEAYVNEIEMIEDDTIQLIEQIKVENTITIDNNSDIQALFMMTPYYWKSSKETSQKVNEMNTCTTTISFDIQVYKKGN